MAATVQIREKNGAGETATDKTSGTVQFKAIDSASVDANNPVVIPSSGQKYSFEKWVRNYIGGTGPDNNITNPKFYTDGSNGMGTGVKLWAKGVGTYVTPVEPSNANDPPQHAAAAMTDAFTHTSASPLALDVTNTGPFSTTSSDFGDYLILVLEAEAGAAPGNVVAETLTFTYDES